MKQAFYPLHKQNIARAWQQESTFLEAFLSVPVVKRACVNEALVLPAYENGEGKLDCKP